jgi:hypothetical protein
VRPEAQPGVAVVLDHLAPGRHGPERDGGLD